MYVCLYTGITAYTLITVYIDDVKFIYCPCILVNIRIERLKCPIVMNVDNNSDACTINISYVNILSVTFNVFVCTCLERILHVFITSRYTRHRPVPTRVRVEVYKNLKLNLAQVSPYNIRESPIKICPAVSVLDYPEHTVRLTDTLTNPLRSRLRLRH